MIAGSALGVGVFLGLFAYLFWHKRKFDRLVDILALVCGLCIAGSVASFLGIATGFTMLGLGMGGITLFLIAWFVMEFRNHGRHPTRTPILGVIVGVLVMAGPLGGPFRTAGQHIEQGVVTHVQNAQLTSGTSGTPAKTPAGHSKTATGHAKK